MMQKRKVIFGLLAGSLLVLAVIGIVTWFLGLDAAYPGFYSFQIDSNNLAEQANGLAWTLTMILVMFYWISGAFLLMEGKVSTADVQRKFHYGLAMLFILIGLAQGIVVFYSIFKTTPFHFSPILIPNMAPLGRSDTLFALAFACWSAVRIIYIIEKYIKKSKKYPLTVLILLGAIAGTAGIACSYIQAATWSNEDAAPSWWQYVGYGVLGLSGLALIITIISLPVIYFSLAIQASGDLRKNSAIIGTGYLLTFVMVILHLLREMILADLPLNWMVFIFGNIIGALILISGYMRSTY
ncbi:MAG: hypothetical protein Q6373_014355 [Candidatus Sigynarchaeota archaeon]